MNQIGMNFDLSCLSSHLIMQKYGLTTPVCDELILLYFVLFVYFNTLMNHYVRVQANAALAHEQ